VTNNDPTLLWHVCLNAHDLLALRLDANNNLGFLRLAVNAADRELDVRVIRRASPALQVRHAVLVLGAQVPPARLYTFTRGWSDAADATTLPPAFAVQVIAGRHDVWYAVQGPEQPLQLAQVYKSDAPFRAHDTENLVARVRTLVDRPRVYARVGSGSLHYEIIEELLTGQYLDAR
jgi:hypothetical protein